MTKWLPVPDYPGYEVSNEGEVRSLDRMIYNPRSETGNWPKYRKYPGRILIPVKTHAGYLRVQLGKNNYFGIHQLVAMTFIGPCPNGMQICHNDGDKTRNKVGNLRYGTPSDNAQDRIKHGHQVDKRGEKHHNAKLTTRQVMKIRSSKATVEALIAQYEISKSQIYRIKQGQRWRHLCP